MKETIKNETIKNEAIKNEAIKNALAGRKVKTMKATEAQKQEIREKSEAKKNGGYMAYVRKSIKPYGTINTEKEDITKKLYHENVTCNTEAEENTEITGKKGKKKKAQWIAEAIAECNGTFSRKYKLNHIVKKARKEQEETKSAKRKAWYQNIITEAEEEISLFEKAEAEAKNIFAINNCIVYCESLNDLMVLDDSIKVIIMKRSIRFQIKKALAHIDKEGNCKPLPIAFVVDEPYFDANMDSALSYMFIHLNELWKLYKDSEKYRNSVNAKAEKIGVNAFRVICGRSAKNALNDIYRKEVQTVKNLQYIGIKKSAEAGYTDGIGHETIDLQAFKTNSPKIWETENQALLDCYMQTVIKTKAEKDVYTLALAGYEVKEIAEFTGKSDKAVYYTLDKIHNRILADRMNQYLDRLDDSARKEAENENNKYLLRVWIMRGIRCGLSYDKIADIMNITDSKDKHGNVTTSKKDKVKAMLKDNVTAEQLLSIKLKETTVSRVPEFYTNGHMMNSKGLLRKYWTTEKAEASKREHDKAMEALTANVMEQETKQNAIASKLEQEAEQIRRWRIYEAEKDGYRIQDGIKHEPAQRTNWNNGKNDWLYTVTRRIERRKREERYLDYLVQKRHEAFEREEAEEAKEA